MQDRHTRTWSDIPPTKSQIAQVFKDGFNMKNLWRFKFLEFQRKGKSRHTSVMLESAIESIIVAMTPYYMEQRFNLIKKLPMN